MSKSLNSLAGYVLTRLDGSKWTCHREMAGQKFLGATLEELQRAKGGEKVKMKSGETLVWVDD